MDSKEKLSNTLSQLCYIIDESNLTRKELHELVCNFLYTIGYSLEGNPSLQNSELVLQRYAERPTFGNALMSQSLWMKETWEVKNERNSDGKREHRDADGRELEVIGSTSVQDLQGNQR